MEGMGRKVWFSKYEALGNDFIVIDLRVPQGGENFSPEEFAKRFCRRRFGVGADGVLTLEKPSSPDFDFKMRVINQDGSEAEMSGNGIRCAAKYVFDTGLKPKTENKVVFETKAGKREVVKTSSGFQVFMGTPRVQGEFELRESEVGGEKLRCVRVDVGNPHIVIFAEGKQKDVFLTIAPHVSESENANVEFIYAVEGVGESGGKNLIVKAWVWERGVGETLACGTGAVAIFTAGKEKGIIKHKKAKVMYEGGELSVLSKENGVFIEGDANFVFSGYVEI